MTKCNAGTVIAGPFLSLNVGGDYAVNPCSSRRFCPLAGCAGHAANNIPGSLLQEILIKSSLLTFNDANLTGNYTVMHAKLAKQFRDTITADRLKQAFKTFSAVWMGHTTLKTEIDAGNIVLTGDKAMTRSIHDWLGLSPFAKEKTRPAS